MAKKIDPRTYKPELVNITAEQQSAIDKYALTADTEIGQLIDEHLKNDFINKMLFPSSKQEALEALDMKDDYFRGMLEGMALKSNYLRERADIQRNPEISKQG